MTLPRRGAMVLLLGVVLLALVSPTAHGQQAGAPQAFPPQQPLQQPCPPAGYPPPPGVPSPPGCGAPGMIQQPFGTAPAMPAQPYGQSAPMYGAPQPYGGGYPGAPMPGNTWSWPPQGSAWPVQPGAQEIVAPDAGQAQPPTPGPPTQTHVPSFVRPPAPPPPPPPAQSDFSQPQFAPPQ